MSKPLSVLIGIALLVPSTALSAALPSTSAMTPVPQPSVIQLEEQLISLLQELVQLLTTQLHAVHQTPVDVVAPTPTPTAHTTAIAATTTSQVACVGGYHECTGANCLHVGVIVAAPYYCFTSTNPVTVVPIPAGAVWPAASCYNADQTQPAPISQSADYFGNPLPAECVPDDPASAL